jgi:6-phosphogluconate dehydrogenase
MSKARIGLVGLGVMGANLALNIAEKGFTVAVHNRTAARIHEFIADAGPLAERLIPAETPAALAAALESPRAIIIMVKAGAPVDETIAALKPHLDPGDIIIDAGNANYEDSERRARELAAEGFRFIGLGVSGGAEGARHGPSLMAGGDASAYAEIEDILTAIAARFAGKPCVALLGPGGAGHFVKTVHNGIEYAEMQLIAEIYGLLAQVEKRRAWDIARLFEEWNEGPLRSYLIEITAKVLHALDPVSGAPMVDVILDRAGQKGTGRWTVIEALKLGQSPLVIEAAVAARAWSSEKDRREMGAELLPAPRHEPAPPILDADLERALIAGRVIDHAQGFALMAAASEAHGWNIDLARVAEIWRAGCIIRSEMLDDIAASIREGLPGGLLIFAPYFVEMLEEAVPGLRRVAAGMILRGQPAPALGAAIAFWDSMRQARGTAALIQAQRDYFGAHGFARIDAEGDDHHGPWAEGS